MVVVVVITVSRAAEAYAGEVVGGVSGEIAYVEFVIGVSEVRVIGDVDG